MATLGLQPGSCSAQYSTRGESVGCCRNDPLRALSTTQTPCLCGALLGLAKFLFFKGEKDTTRTFFTCCQCWEVPSHTCCARLACGLGLLARQRRCRGSHQAAKRPQLPSGNHHRPAKAHLALRLGARERREEHLLPSSLPQPG